METNPTGMLVINSGTDIYTNTATNGRGGGVSTAGETIIEADFHRLYDIVELVLENQKTLYSEEEQ